MNKVGFDTEKYLKAQKKAIEERLGKFSGRLYLEFGGKLLWDYHASRTLPGYDPNAKLRLLKSLKANAEVLYCVSAKQLSSGKIRGDFGIGYDMATIQAIQELDSLGLPVSGVVINRCDNDKDADIFAKRLKRMGVRVYRRFEIDGYPNNLEKIFSKEGYGKDEYIDAKKKLVVVWGAGPGSGKLSTCLGQTLLDEKHGINSGYAKFETFPVWNLPLNHPVNIAYEAATADLGDFNLVDPFHKKAYGKIAINYNRDVDSFPIIKRVFEKVLKKGNYSRNYQSPTDMGFNVLKEGIIDDKIVRQAAKKEIAFYLFRYREEYKKGLVDEKVLERIEAVMKKAKVTEETLKTVVVARKAKKEAEKTEGKGDNGIFCGAAIELNDGTIIYGKNSSLLHSEASAVLNAIKQLSGIADNIHLIAQPVIKQVNELKKSIGDKSCSLNCSEALLALAVSSSVNPFAEKAQECLKDLRGCFMHCTHTPSLADQSLFRKLGIWVSTDGVVGKIG